LRANRGRPMRFQGEGMNEPQKVLPRLVEKIESLPTEAIAEVETFVDYLRWHSGERDRTAPPCPCCAALRRVWDNPDDAVYDDL
jgi:hypothetical protein